ncbi:unnamed protein product [Effrenium voratum]|nr:unnamed protein product [Effrenium voratum]
MVVEPQPPQPTAPAPAPAPAPAAAGSSDCASPRSPDISTTASSSPPPEESSPSGRGVVLELPAADVERLGPHALDFLEAAACPSRGWWGTLGQVLGRRWLFSSLRGVVDELTLVVPVDLDPWEVTWDFSQNLKLPSMRFAVVLHLDVSASCRFSRVSAAFPEELTLNVARCLQEQIQQWDLREIDPRFAGFTQPARVTFDLEAEWISQQMLRLTTKNLGSRLDLPAS